MNQFINLTLENIENEHLCCIIRTKKKHNGVETKREWLKERIKEGHVFRKLDVKGCAFIEYAPLQLSWVPIIGDNYLYIYCLYVLAELKGKGYAKELIEYCIQDAKNKNKSGICFLGSKKQKGWLLNQEFMKKYNFKVVDETSYGYQLYALSFDGHMPYFCENAKKGQIEDNSLVIYYDHQCPYIEQTLDKIKENSLKDTLDIKLHKINSLQEAKNLPCVFNNWAVFYKGQFQTINLLDYKSIKKIIKK